MYTFTFNTGRLYTKEGQVISVSFDYRTQMIYFNDHSRMVDGSMKARKPYASREPANFLIAAEVMDRYDRGSEAGVEYYCPHELRPKRQEFVHNIKI